MNEDWKIDLALSAVAVCIFLAVTWVVAEQVDMVSILTGAA